MSAVLKQTIWSLLPLKTGPLGAKMSGGGLGGCVIALVKDSREAATIAHALEKEGAHHTWIENL